MKLQKVAFFRLCPESLSHNSANLLHRAAFLTTPCLILKLLIGQMPHEILFSGQKVIPHKWVQSGFILNFTDTNHAV